MKKRYELIHIPDGYIYGIDKETPPKVGEYYISDKDKVEECFDEDDVNYLSSKPEYKIFFSNNPSLGLPLLPDIEEDPEISAYKLLDSWLYNPLKKEEYGHLSKDELSILHEGFVKGYKAASLKKWTDKDIEYIIMNIMDGDYIHTIKSRHDMVVEVERQIEYYNKIFLELRRPISVDVKMKYIEIPCPDNIEGCEVLHQMEMLDLVDNNVQVKKWVYEKQKN